MCAAIGVPALAVGSPLCACSVQRCAECLATVTQATMPTPHTRVRRWLLCARPRILVAPRIAVVFAAPPHTLATSNCAMRPGPGQSTYRGNTPSPRRRRLATPCKQTHAAITQCLIGPSAGAPEAPRPDQVVAARRHTAQGKWAVGRGGVPRGMGASPVGTECSAAARGTQGCGAPPHHTSGNAWRWQGYWW